MIKKEPPPVLLALVRIPIFSEGGLTVPEYFGKWGRGTPELWKIKAITIFLLIPLFKLKFQNCRIFPISQLNC
jgi:hypothetical protein